MTLLSSVEVKFVLFFLLGSLSGYAIREIQLNFELITEVRGGR